MKRLLPPVLRLWLRVVLRQWQDWRSGQSKRFVRRSRSRHSLSILSQGNPQITIAQDLKVSQYSENKRQNLIQASNHIQAIVIQPGQIFILDISRRTECPQWLFTRTNLSQWRFASRNGRWTLSTLWHSILFGITGRIEDHRAISALCGYLHRGNQVYALGV